MKTKTKKKCGNCKYEETRYDSKPCHTCKRNLSNIHPDNWEAFENGN